MSPAACLPLLLSDRVVALRPWAAADAPDVYAAVENHSSRKVARKLGAKFEGILLDRSWIRGKGHDAHVYSLIRTDPIARSL